jgi:O-methyltransferase
VLRRLLSSLWQRKSGLPGPPDADERPAGPGFIAPLFALINKLYREPPFDRARAEKLVAGLREAARVLQPNRPGGHAFLADDMLVWFRTVGFLSDEAFVWACLPHAEDGVIRARIWRVYALCWAARSCLALPGHYVDLGCYDGKTVEIIARYLQFWSTGRSYYVYDAFDNPPEESRKLHGPHLHAEVEQRLRPLGRFRVIQGLVPESFAQGLPERIAFAQIDLNDADAEIACLARIYERVVPGGIIVLDDYGLARYRRTYELEKRFFAERGQQVLELPTGQGLFLKR